MESPNPNIISLTTGEKRSTPHTVIFEADALEIEERVIFGIGSRCHLPSLECALHVHSLKSCGIGWIHRERSFGKQLVWQKTRFSTLFPVRSLPMETESIDDRCPGHWVTSCQKCLNYLYLDEKEYESER